ARRAASRDDADLDDAEPRSWKRVDEAELARRVREMREARAAPSVQALDQKAAAAAAARKALTSVQTLPKGVEVLDPLGLGVMDNKSLRLITEASMSSPVSREKSQGLDPSMRGMPVHHTQYPFLYYCSFLTNGIFFVHLQRKLYILLLILIPRFFSRGSTKIQVLLIWSLVLLP
uniref:Exocyst complex component SEC5 n=1 Tax=Aegilops tauschii subsp. strangulata TaxID=200361 RepID=A0A453BYS7_AEGTS